MKYLFACGGTAGHIYPAISVAACLKREDPAAEFLFIGADGMMETELVPREGYKILTVPVTNLSRERTFHGLQHNIHTAANVIHSLELSKKYIREFCPDFVIGTGGYVCFPVLRAAHELKIPTYVHEANAVPGLTTKMVASFADCVMTAFPDVAAEYPHASRVRYTGMPVRPEFYEYTRSEARMQLGIPEEKPLVLSVWGSLGSDYMNTVIPELMRRCGSDGKFMLLHSAGKRGYDLLPDDIRGMKLIENSAQASAYLYEMPRLMAAADLILCRAGASTLGELTAVGLPAILIPSPNVTNHHQEKNAKALASQGGAEVLLEGEFTQETLYDKISGLLSDTSRMEKMRECMKQSGERNAAEKMTAIILKKEERT